MRGAVRFDLTGALLLWSPRALLLGTPGGLVFG
jgi:hypothetical protein